MSNQKIKQFLAELKAEGKSSPAGIYWHEFFKFITKGIDKEHHPKNPLILGGSIASHQHKQERLQEHLSWAHERGLLDEAIRYLENIEIEGWNIGTKENWRDVTRL